MLKVEPIPALQDNYIWAIHDGQAVAVVDPGDAAPVLAYLDRSGLQLSAILVTHHHGDHQGGVAQLLAAHPLGPDGRPIPVVGPAREKIGQRTRAVAQDDIVTLAQPSLTLRVLEVPGHTAGHIAYAGELDGIGPVLFCGDTLFASGCGRLFEGSPAQMLGSLDQLAALADDTRVYCAHEYTASNVRFARAVEPDNPALAAWQEEVAQLRASGRPTLPTTIGHEREVNPFLRSRLAPVRQALAGRLAKAAQAGANDAAAFAALRAWKDEFR